MCKLRRLKIALRKEILQDGDSDEHRVRETACHEDLNVALSEQHDFYSQRNKLDWLADGDRNTSFFHIANKVAAKPKDISSLNINTIVHDPSVISAHIVNFFSSFFG